MFQDGSYLHKKEKQNPTNAALTKKGQERLLQGLDAVQSFLDFGFHLGMASGEPQQDTAGRERMGPGLTPCRVSWDRLRPYTEATASLTETLLAGCSGSSNRFLFLPLQDQEF